MLTTTQVAKRLGITPTTLSRYIAVGKVPTPALIQFGKFRVHSWSEADVERLRKLLPKIANGRKTRYQKKQLAVGTQHSAKAKTKAPAGVPAPHKQKRAKKKSPRGTN